MGFTRKSVLCRIDTGSILSLLLTEALKDRRWRFVEFADCFGKNFLEISSQFQSLCPPDAIIVSPESTSLSGSERSEVIAICISMGTVLFESDDAVLC